MAPARLVKPAAWLLGLTPLAILATGGIGVDPIETVTLLTGFWALTLLMCSLAITPLRRVTGWNWLIGARKVLGNFAFFYAVLHFATYLVDQSFSWGFIVADVWEHTGPPWHGKLAEDRFHPGALGYADWAAAFADVLHLALPAP